MRHLVGIIIYLLLLNSCHQQGKLPVILSKFPNDSIKEIIYFDLPITKDSIGFKEIYFENGKLQAKGNYILGKREGEWVCYRRDGKLEWKANYQNDIENGLTECFKENGSWRKITVINGTTQGATTEYNIDSTGREIWVYGQYKNSQEDGDWIWRNQDGKVLARQYYSEGKPDKYHVNYYKNGAVFNKAFLRNGYIDSLKTYDSLGSLIDTKYYHDATFCTAQ